MSDSSDDARPSSRSQRALDWLNFFIADVQTGFGPFVAVYLAANGWAAGQIGIVLTIGSIVGVVSQLPGGAIVDAAPSKRLVVAVALGMIAAGALIFVVWPSFVPIVVAEVLHGGTAGLIQPSLAAIGLGLVGHRALSNRLGRNGRYKAFGNAGTAAAMGLLGHFVAKWATFLVAGALCLPALFALSRINGKEIDNTRARGASREPKAKPARLRDLARNRNLLLFGLCLVLFQFANASVLTLEGERLGQQHQHEGELVIAALTVVPQVITALIATWVARRADDWGRKPLLLIGFGAVPIQVILFTVAPGPWYLVPIQALGGITAAVIGVLTPLVVADVVRGSGRYNLGLGAIGTAMGVGAAVSTTLMSYVAQYLGFDAGFSVLAAVGLLGAVILWWFLPETQPEEHKARR